jgi:hypothetical protein
MRVLLGQIRHKTSSNGHTAAPELAAAGTGLKPASQPYAATIRFTQNSLTVAPALNLCVELPLHLLYTLHCNKITRRMRMLEDASESSQIRQSRPEFTK